MTTAVAGYSAATSRLADRSSLMLLQIWDSLPSWSIEDSLSFHAAARPIVVAAASASVDLTRAFASTLTPEISAPSTLIIEDATTHMFDPFDRYARLIDSGTDWDDALASAREVARSVGHDTVYRTARQAIAEMVSVPGGWVRLVTGKSCQWCMSLSGVVFSSAAAATFGHSNCDCIPVPTDIGQPANTRTRAEAGWDESAEARYDQRHQRRRLDDQHTTALRHQEQSRLEQLTEPDPIRRERLSIREQEWETRAERVAERLSLLAA